MEVIDADKLRGWLEDGTEVNARWMLVIISDKWNYRCYPVYATEDEDVHERMEDYSDNFTSVKEVYSYRMGWEKQLAERRAWHPDRFSWEKRR